MIIGHERIIKFLQRILAEDTAIHGFLFFGPAEVGKRTTASLFAKGLLCRNFEWGGCENCAVCSEFNQLGFERDFLEVRREEGAGIGIERAREIVNFLHSSPQLSGRKVVLVDDADHLTPEAANALLKTLEEPPGKSILILVTAKPGRLFETIRSRLVPLHFRPVKSAKIVQAIGNEEIAKLSFGRIGRALKFKSDSKLFSSEKKLIDDLERLASAGIPERFAFAEKVSSGSIGDTLASWQLVLREQMVGVLENQDQRKLSDLVKLLKRSQWAMMIAEDTNVSKRLILENLLLSL